MTESRRAKAESGDFIAESSNAVVNRIPSCFFHVQDSMNNEFAGGQVP
jgi:hypothetical protein